MVGPSSSTANEPSPTPATCPAATATSLPCTAAGTTLRVANSFTLKQEWEPKQAGTVFYQVYTWHGLVVQFLPGLTSPTSLLDVRVRRALAHSIDRSAINDAINGGIALEADYY